MPKRVKGVYENPPASGIWWILDYVEGKRHRERLDAAPMLKSRNGSNLIDTKTGFTTE